MATNKYLIDSPTGSNKACQGLQLAFSDSLPWLQLAYGEAFRNTRIVEGKQEYYPAIYTGSGEYVELVPDQIGGNYVFFYIESPENYNILAKGKQLDAFVNAVFFADLRIVRPLATHRPTAEMKDDILSVLNSQYSPDYAINQNESVQIFDRFEDVFTEYSYNEMSQIPNMSEFAVMRVRFNITANNC